MIQSVFIRGNKKKEPYLGHAHPPRKLIFVHIVIPEVGIHNGKLIMSKARRENLIAIERLCPSIADRRGRGETLHSGITTGSRGRDEWVGGRHLL